MCRPGFWRRDLLSSLIFKSFIEYSLIRNDDQSITLVMIEALCVSFATDSAADTF